MAKNAPTDLQALLSATRIDIDATRGRIEALAGREAASLDESDEAYGGWLRAKRLEEKEYARLLALASKTEADIAAERANAARAAYAAWYNTAAALNREVDKLYQTELTKAWGIVSNVLERAALAQIETEAVLKAMPADFIPRTWIGDPDQSVRCRAAVAEEIVSERIVDLWVDPATGATFANQDAPPSVASIKKRFREVTYRPFRPAGDVPPFYRDLKFPRLDAVGSSILFDGARLSGPHEVLEALRKGRQRAKVDAPILTKIEPLAPEKTPLADARIRPPMISN